jgi:uncharacterized membrane protein (DUF485 family)
MVGLDHGAAHPAEEEHQHTIDRNARVGMRLFLVYLALYTSYVLTTAFRPDVMELEPIAGVNLAILSGFGLIVAAMLLALVYTWICRRGGSEGQSPQVKA